MANSMMMDSTSLASEHEADSGIGSMNSVDSLVYVRVFIPDLSIQKCLQFNLEETVWAAKQQILSSVAKGLRDGFNYGLYLPPMNGKAGKFLGEERPLKDYPMNNLIGYLQLIMKRRIYKHAVGNIRKMKQLHSKVGLKQFIESVRKEDVEKVIKLTNQGLDPNFIDPESGETALTLSILSKQNPTKMIVSLVGGGAHLDVRNRKGLTAMHVAGLNGKEEAIKALLDLGASANYRDVEGLTPLYHGVCNNCSPRCVEMLLYDHALLGATDESNWTELHHACKNGHVQHLELMIYYGANLNAQNSGGNTSLHMCAANNKEDCARVLLFRGADKTIKNFANHDAFETAIISGNTVLAQIINDFSAADVVPYQELPSFNEKRRARLFSGTSAPLQRSRSIPQLNLSFDGNSLDRNGLAARNAFDLTLPRTAPVVFDERGAAAAPAARFKRRRSDLPGVPEFFRGTTKQQRSYSKDVNGLAPGFGRGQVSRVDGQNTIKTVFLKPGKTGYGFILRGAKGSGDILNFVPTPEVPAQQYFSSVEYSSLAHRSGVKQGDFLLEVNGQDVRHCSHTETVQLIKEVKDMLCLIVCTPISSIGSVATWASNTALSSIQGAPVIPNYGKMNGLAELENLDRVLSEMDFESSCGTSASRLNIASDVHTLNRMAQTLRIDPNRKTANINSIHGKRLTTSVPLSDIFQSNHGRSVGRLAYGDASQFNRGNLWKASSVQNLTTEEESLTAVDEDRFDSLSLRNPFFGGPGVLLPSYDRVLSVPDSELISWKQSTGTRSEHCSRLTNEGTPMVATTTSHPPILPPKTRRDADEAVNQMMGGLGERSVAIPNSQIVNKMPRTTSHLLSSLHPASAPPPPPPPPPPMHPPALRLSSRDSSLIIRPSLPGSQQSKTNPPTVRQNNNSLLQAIEERRKTLENTSSAITQSQPQSFDSTFQRSPSSPEQSPCLVPMNGNSNLSTRRADPSFPSDRIKPAEEKAAVTTNRQPSFLKENSVIKLSTTQIPSNRNENVELVNFGSSSSSSSSSSQNRSSIGDVVVERPTTGATAMNGVQSTKTSLRPVLADLLKVISEKAKQKSLSSTSVKSNSRISRNSDHETPSVDVVKTTGNVVTNGKKVPSAIIISNPQKQIAEQYLNKKTDESYKNSAPVIRPILVPLPAPFHLAPPPPPLPISLSSKSKSTQKRLKFADDNQSIGDIDLDLPPPPPPEMLLHSPVDECNDDDDRLSVSFLPPPPHEFDDLSDKTVGQSSGSSSSSAGGRRFATSSTVANNSFPNCLKQTLVMQPPSIENVTHRQVRTWSVDDVVVWLRSINMNEHVDSFVRNVVDGQRLSQLGRNELISLGVTQVGQRMNIERAIKKAILALQ